MKLFCTSSKCCTTHNIKPVEKEVPAGATTCPDCGYFLIKKKIRHQTGRKRLGNRSSVYGN